MPIVDLLPQFIPSHCHLISVDNNARVAVVSMRSVSRLVLALQYH